MAPTIAFIGINNMGLPMASNLVKAGQEFTGFDVVPAANKATSQAGIRIASSAAEAVKTAEMVVSMLPNGRLVLEPYGRPQVQAGTDFSGIIKAIRNGS